MLGKKAASQCNLDLWKYTQAHRRCLHEIDPNKSSRVLSFENKIIWNDLCFTKKYLKHKASTAYYPPLSKFLLIYNTALWFSCESRTGEQKIKDLTIKQHDLQKAKLAFDLELEI